MNTLALYSIADQYLADLQKLEAMDIDEQTFNDTLEGLSGDIEVKATNVAMFAKNLEAMALAIKNAELQMADRRKRIEKKQESIESYLLANMQRCGIKKIDSPYFSISIRNNPESVIVDAEVAIPDEFFVYPEIPAPTIDKRKLKEVIQAGVTIPGVHLERKQSLQIK